MRPTQKAQFGLQRYNYFLILPNIKTKNPAQESWI